MLHELDSLACQVYGGRRFVVEACKPPSYAEDLRRGEVSGEVSASSQPAVVTRKGEAGIKRERQRERDTQREKERRSEAHVVPAQT